MNFLPGISISAALLLTAQAAWAHHPGGSGNVSGAGPINTISATTLGAGQSSRLHKIGSFSDSKLIEFASRHIHAHSLDAILSPSIAYAYGLTNDLTVSVRLPYVTRTDIREGHHSHVHGGGVLNEADHRGDASGIGDLTAMLQWRLLNNRSSGTEWALLAGVKAPTGIADRSDRQGSVFELEFQPGSGSWDVSLGGAVTQNVGRWSYASNVLFTFVTSGNQDTDLGDRFQYNFAAAYRLFDASGAMHLGALPMYHGAGRSGKDAGAGGTRHCA